MMVDWITAHASAGPQFPNPALYDTGRILRLSPGGAVDDMSASWLPVPGSHDSRLMVKSPTGDDLWLSGNPVKFFQGHNLFGPSDAEMLYFSAGAHIGEAVKLFPNPAAWQSLGFHGPRFTRIDLTRSYRFESAALARSWLRNVAATARSRHGGALLKHETVYFGKNSTRWALKCYHKGDEITDKKKGHSLPLDLPGRQALIEWAQGVVRFEITLRSPELEKLDLSALSPLDLWSMYNGRVQWNRNCEMKTLNPHYDVESDLPRGPRTALRFWLEGIDVRQYVSQATYFRHRRFLLDHLGVDIAAPPSTEVPKYRAELEPAGWDPEPLSGHTWQPVSHNYPTKRQAK